MASYIALSSSPDPLGTDFEPPGSMRPPPTQRTVAPTTISRSNSRRQSGRISIPASSTQRSAWGTERQTFELDVSSGRSPQRLIVTVEAEEPSHRGAISRRLFGGDSSPTRSRSRRRDTMNGATTTMVPLRGLTDDEGGEMNTPRGRGRGRPLGSKNGTPAPRGTKRSGTPLLKESRPARRRKNSEYGESILSDAPLDMGTDDLEPQDSTPKPKPKARKNTPARKAGTPAVTTGKPTGRKRGRPRKSVAPEEAAAVKDASKEPEPVLDTDLLLPSEDALDQIPAQAPHEQRRAEAAPPDDPMPSISPAPEEATPRNASRHQYSPEKSQSVDRMQQSPHNSQDAAYDEHVPDIYMREPSSDVDSDAGAGEGRDTNQDTLAQLDEFTMIALDTLPSFQESFQASRSGLQRNPDPSTLQDQAGDETNMMINQSMESLRSSAQGQMQPEAPREDTAPAAAGASSSVAAQSSPSSYALSSPQVWSRSPRRPKSMPLSKQVFVNKAHVAEDSPSSKPGSARKGATPNKPLANPSGAAVENASPDSYEDSFSEIPDEVLAAATPKQPYQNARTSGTGTRGVRPYQQEAQVMNHAGFPLGQNKLPTPDDTNSSTTGSKNTQEDEPHGKTGDAPLALNTSDLNIHSSPPAFHQRRTREPEVEPEMEPEMGPAAGAGTEHEPEHPYSGSDHSESPSPLGSPSPQRSSAAVTGTATQPAQTLEPSMTGRRPTLSPIVRVGRSLQNVMSDRSSPEGREGSLGSPFRGSASADSRQSSIQKSPGTERRESVHQPGSRSFFNPLASLAQSIRSNFGQAARHAPSSSPDEQVEESFGPESPERSSPLPSMGNPARANAEGAEPSPEPGQMTQPRSMVSSVTVPPSETATGDWTPMESSPSTRRTKRMAAPKSSAMANPKNGGPRGYISNASHSIEPEPMPTTQGHEQPLQYTQEPEARRNTSQEEEEFSDLEFDYVEVEEPAENGDWGRGEEQGIPATDLGQGDRNGSAEEIRASLEDVGPQDVMTNGQFDDADDDMDIWDFEASRATQSPQDGQADEPTRRDSHSYMDGQADEQTRRDSHSYMDGRSSQAPLQLSTNTGLARRGKASSPFRKMTRRLIYKDDFKSPSQIDLDESPTSEGNQALSAVSRTEPQKKPQETAPVRAEDVARTTQREAQEVAPGLPERDGRVGDNRDESPDYQFSKDIRDDTPEHVDERAEDIRDELQDHHFSRGARHDLPEQADERAEDTRDESPGYQYPEEIRDDTPEHAYEVEVIQGNSPEHRFSQASRNDSPEHDLLLELGGSVHDATPSAAANRPNSSPRRARQQLRNGIAEEQQMTSPGVQPTDYSLLLDQEQVTEMDQHDAPTAAESEDYSMLSRQKKNAEKKPTEETTEKAAPRRSGLFGGFDIMSFFSSPAALPRDNGGPQSQAKTKAVPKDNPQQSRRGQPPSSDGLPEEPQSAPRATGLFPSIRPRSKQLSPERPADIFQPSSARRSTNTVPDTYANSPTTPGQQGFHSIPQKQNFTPLTNRTIRTASLFTPSVAQGTPARDEAFDDASDDASDDGTNEGTPESEQNSRHGHEAQEDGGEDSIMTEESEYERYPPRASPSRWDRTLSPIKSSLRSPLKPKTPGKVVEFAEYASASLAPAQPSAFARQTSGMSGTAPNGVPGQRQPAADPRTAQDDKENGPSPPKDDFFTLPAATSLRGNAAMVEPVKNGNVRLAPFEAAKGAGPKPTTTGATFAAPPPMFPKSSLSQTTWTRAHWVRLDELLQLRRRDPRAFQQQQQQQRLAPPLLLHDDPARRASPGRLRALVGKEVTSRGERVLLEPWHLEVVEAFRRDVGGWDEEALAKRLFALIVGEERRDAAKAGAHHQVFA